MNNEKMAHRSTQNGYGGGGGAEYWTIERRRAAKLHPAAVGKPLVRGNEGAEAKFVRPILQANQIPKRAELDSYQTSHVSNVREFPASTIGKIYFSHGSNDSFATGFVVGNRTVFTVASALFDRGGLGWATNVVFYPEYDHGPAGELGAFSIAELWVAANWQETGDLIHDFGAIITSVPIQPHTGSLGVIANLPINQGQYLVYGYPGSPVPGYPFDGEGMWQTTSAYMGDVAWIIQAAGNMTYGAHGAPWLIFREGGWHANGIFAVQVVNPDSMLSPYFGNEFWDFFTYLQGKGYV